MIQFCLKVACWNINDLWTGFPLQELSYSYIPNAVLTGFVTSKGQALIWHWLIHWCFFRASPFETPSRELFHSPIQIIQMHCWLRLFTFKCQLMKWNINDNKLAASTIKDSMMEVMCGLALFMWSIKDPLRKSYNILQSQHK